MLPDPIVAPQLDNAYTQDPFLGRLLQQWVSPALWNEMDCDLERFGRVVATSTLGRDVEENPPRLLDRDGWGAQPSSPLWTHPAWMELHDMAAREGLVALPYGDHKRRYGKDARIFQFAKLFLFHPSSGMYSCPLAMTDGCAKVLETMEGHCHNIFTHLTTTDAAAFWTSGQWMTEQNGGSDVSRATETVAVQLNGPMYALSGLKWFTSASDANVTLALAKIKEQEQVDATPTLFLLQTRLEDGSLNGIQMEKLKKKLGTRQLPTAEMRLHGARAMQCSERGRGIPRIAAMLNITRLHNTICAAASMRRIVALATDYATKRTAFGSALLHHPLHQQTLLQLETETRAATILAARLAELLGMLETDTDDVAQLVRILTPLCKLFTAKRAVAVLSEGIECFGGQGYIEDTGIPALLRDTQVLPIWEGTTNILSLDVLRSIHKSKGECIHALVVDMRSILSHSRPSPNRTTLDSLVSSIPSAASSLTEQDARDFAMHLAALYAGCLLLRYASSSLDSSIASSWTAAIPAFPQHQSRL